MSEPDVERINATAVLVYQNSLSGQWIVELAQPLGATRRYVGCASQDAALHKAGMLLCALSTLAEED